jgi:hypothetical protein
MCRRMWSCVQAASHPLQPLISFLGQLSGRDQASKVRCAQRRPCCSHCYDHYRAGVVVAAGGTPCEQVAQYSARLLAHAFKEQGVKDSADKSVAVAMHYSLTTVEYSRWCPRCWVAEAATCLQDEGPHDNAVQRQTPLSVRQDC